MPNDGMRYAVGSVSENHLSANEAVCCKDKRLARRRSDWAEVCYGIANRPWLLSQDWPPEDSKAQCERRDS